MSGKIKSIQCFEGEDGRIYRTEAEAIRGELEARFCKWYRQNLDLCVEQAAQMAIETCSAQTRLDDSPCSYRLLFACQGRNEHPVAPKLIHEWLRANRKDLKDLGVLDD